MVLVTNWAQGSCTVQCSKKETLRPETGPEFSRNNENPKLFDTSVFPAEFSILRQNSNLNTTVPKRIVSAHQLYYLPEPHVMALH